MLLDPVQASFRCRAGGRYWFSQETEIARTANERLRAAVDLHIDEDMLFVALDRFARIRHVSFTL
jgi:hypothetical protein